MQTQRSQISDLIQANEILENYFSNTIIPQLFVDAEMILRKFTPPAMSQFELTEESIGKSIEDIKDNFRIPGIIDNIQNVIATRKILEKEIQTTDMRWYQMNILPYVTRTDNKANGVIITFINITSRIRDLKEQERLVAEHELLLDTIAHDIKNPLLGLTLTVQVIKKTFSPGGKLAKLIEGLEKSVNSIKQVVEGLMHSRWSTHRYQDSPESLDLKEIQEEVMLSLTLLIQESGAIIRSRFDISEIKFIRRKLRSVLYNLISNAIKYTPAGKTPEVTIVSHQVEDFVVIQVTDNGIGLSDHSKALIFEKFKRVDRSVEGTGVGLYLVNTIVTKAGGKIEIESEEGKGSTFNIYLPLH